MSTIEEMANMPPKAFENLLRRRINFEYGDAIINTFTILEIVPLEEFSVGLEGNGRIYLASIKWEKEFSGSGNQMTFPEDVFDELTNAGVAIYKQNLKMKYRMAPEQQNIVN